MEYLPEIERVLSKVVEFSLFNLALYFSLQSINYLETRFKIGSLERTIDKEKSLGLAEKVLANSASKGIVARLVSYGGIKAIEDYISENRPVKE